MSEARVTIIIPCYNAARWLAATLESALAQTWTPTEIVLVDDGSTDDSLQIARRYESARVRVIAQANAGAAAARNSGLRAAQGDFVQFLDADDLLAPDKIARQMARLKSSDPMVLASGAWARFQNNPAEARFTGEANERDLTGVEFLQINFEARTMMHPAAWLAPRALLEHAGPWDESLSLNDDGEYFARVALTSGRIMYCGDARSYYRSNLPGSLSGRKDPRALRSLHRSMELTIAHLLQRDASPRSRAAAAYAWKCTAFELYPGAPDLARTANDASRNLGGSVRPFPGSGRFLLAARFLGWRLARRLFP